MSIFNGLVRPSSRTLGAVLTGLLLAGCGGTAAPASSPAAPASVAAKPSTAASAPAAASAAASGAASAKPAASGAASAKPAASGAPAASAAAKPSAAAAAGTAAPCKPTNAASQPGALGAALRPFATIDMPGVGLNPQNARGLGLSTDFIRYDPTSKLTYLTDGANLAVDVFDTASKKMTERIPVSGAPHDVIVDDSLSMMAVPMSNKKVGIINLKTGTEKDLDVGGTSIADLAGYDPQNHIVALGSKGQTQLTFIQLDPAGSKVVKQVQLGKDNPEEPRFFNGKFYLSICEQIAVVDPSSFSITSRIDVPGCEGHGFAMGPGSEAYLGCTAGGAIVDLGAGKVVAQFTPAQIGDTDQPTYDPGKKRYYAPGHVSRNGADVAVMAVIDATTHQLVSTQPTDPGSGTQAAADGNGTVWISTNPAVGGDCLSICLFGYKP